MAHDLVIRNGQIVDGTGAEPRPGDLAIDGGIITGLPWDWEDYGGYLDAIERLRPALNVAGMVGHCAVRFYVMGQRTSIKLGQGCVGGEAVFVPSASPESEDDGWLMTYVYDARSDSNRFVIMDAATMDNTPVASVELPRIPHGFHGNWIPASVAN